jgi:DNA-binding response OmpR family regulator
MGRQVLLIEDEASIAEAIRFILTRDGFSVRVLTDGLAAEAALAEGRPDILIVDLMLPGRSGLEIVAALRADPRLADLPVMMLTARGQGRDRAAAEAAGVDRFITKPFANAEILAEVRALAAGRA